MNVLFKKVSKDIDNIALGNFSVDILQSMYCDYEDGQSECVRGLSYLNREIEVCILKKNGLRAIELKKKSKKIQAEFQELQESKEKIWGLIQEKKLNNRLIEKLGSSKLLKIKEIIITSLIFFVLSLMYYEFKHPELSSKMLSVFYYLDTAACLVFLFNFFFELSLADSKKWYWKSHIIDFITSIPLPNLQVIRAGRVLRLTRLIRLSRVLRVLRGLRVILLFYRGLDQLTEIFDIKLMKKSFLICVIVLLIGGFAIYFAEDSQVGVNNLSESIWWSFTTVVTGGFGDIHNPQTPAGRILTVVLIVLGMVLVGVFTATLTSILVADDSENIVEIKEILDRQVGELASEIKSLKDSIDDAK